MELKTARLTLLIDPNKKAAFERLCAQQDRTASQVVRQLIRDYLAHHGVEYETSGTDDEGAVHPAPAAAAEKPAQSGVATSSRSKPRARSATRRRQR
jgi:hypothetical protein